MATQAAFMPGAEVKPQSVLWSWLTTVDHKRIGILYGTSAFIFFLIGGIEALIMRVQLARPDNNFVSAATFNELFTMHGTTMVFLAIMPLSAAFFNYMIPLMIGARDVAFPRLNALSYWIFLSGGLFLHASFLVGAAPNGGWFGYANLTARQYSPGHHIDFWMLGLQILGIASMLAGFNFIVTIINMRAPGMTLMRMPVFIWMSFVTQFLLVLAFPAITVALILLMFDRFFGTLFYAPQAGGDPLLWQHLFWIFGHPEVYILILPAMGIVSEVLPTFARKPLFGAPVVIYSGITIGFFGFGVWSHHMFSVGMGPVADSAFSIATMLIAVPTGVKILNWISTLWGGAIRFSSALYFSLGFIAMFTMGGLSGVMHASPPVDLQQTDTYFVVAHFHYVLFGGSIFGIFSGFYYWWPKMTGRLLDERLGKWHFWLMMLGFNMTFFPQHYLGLIGMPRRIYTYAPDLGWNFWNMVSSIGAFVIAGSILIFIVNVFKTQRSGVVAGPDPWDARTLEWSIPSPPPVYNFAVIPTSHGRDDLWLQKHGDGHGGAPTPRPPAPTKESLAAIHMPPPSYWPLLLAIAVTIMVSGVMFSTAQIVIGGLLTLYCMTKFMLEYHRPAEGAALVAGAADAHAHAPTAAHGHAAGADAHAHHDPNLGNTGLDNRKVGMWIFLGSDCMFFGSLIGTYLSYKGKSLSGPTPHDVFNIPLTSESAAVLLLSSLTMVLALAAVQRDDRWWSGFWLLSTALLGLHFVLNQVYEFYTFAVHDDLTLSTNLFGSSFFVLTGFHGAHVTGGVIWLLGLFVLNWRRRLDSRDSMKVEVAGLYWHFVDIVWIAIFTIVYLIP